MGLDEALAARKEVTAGPSLLGGSGPAGERPEASDG